jgi:hypothetical protein
MPLEPVSLLIGLGCGFMLAALIIPVVRWS